MLQTTSPARHLPVVEALARGVERRAALRAGLLAGARPRPAAPAFRLREEHGADAGRLRDVAALDESPLPGAPRLVAEADGVVVAVIGVLDRRVVADPFVRTAEAVDGLQAVAAELRGPLRRARRAGALRSRLAALRPSRAPR